MTVIPRVSVDALESDFMEIAKQVPPKGSILAPGLMANTFYRVELLFLKLNLNDSMRQSEISW